MDIEILPTDTTFHPPSTGGDIVRKALKIPCFTIAHNAGVDANEVVNNVVQGKQEIGYDAMNGTYVDMLKTGIIDPTKVLVLSVILFKRDTYTIIIIIIIIVIILYRK